MAEGTTQVFPFKLLVDDLEAPPTLLKVSMTTGVHVNDLKLWNAQNVVITSAGVTDELPFGTIVQLPPLTFVRHPSFGCNFRIGEALLEMQQAQSQLVLLAESTQVPFVPKRRVTSRAAHFVDALRRESATQLSRIQSEYRSIDPTSRYGRTWKELLVEEVVDASPVALEILEHERAFVSSGLTALQPENAACMAQAPIRMAPNIVNELTEHRARDFSASEGEEILCPFHGREIEVCFFQPGRAAAHKETWAVLACQTLAALVDALECVNEALPYPKTRNSFMFIAGTFYIDDRHEGFEDISSVIRDFDPTNALPPGSNAAYGACPVKSITTSIADVHIKMHEMCVYRHMGSCDHYFFFKDFSAPLTSRKARSQYPRRVYLSRSPVTLCDMCAALPSTIITYGDLQAPKNPTYYCPPCFRVFHLNEDGEEVNDGYVKFELPPGQHF